MVYLLHANARLRGEANALLLEEARERLVGGSGGNGGGGGSASRFSASLGTGVRRMRRVVSMMPGGSKVR